MADEKADQRKIDASPDSTWGATEQAKRAWSDKHAVSVRRAVAKDNEQKASE